MVEPMNLEQRCHTEVIELHRFFQDWMNAVLEPTDENFRLSEVLADNFAMVTPVGARVSRPEIEQQARASHGAYRDSEEPLTIRIENLEGRALTTGAYLLGYDEWQETPDGNHGRRSTAVFREQPDAPNGVEWVHVHETWLPDEGATSDS